MHTVPQENFVVFGSSSGYKGEDMTAERTASLLGASDNGIIPEVARLSVDEYDLFNDEILLGVCSVEVQQDILYRDSETPEFEEAVVELQRQVCRKLGMPAEMGRHFDIRGQSEEDEKIRGFLQEEVSLEIDHVTQGSNKFDNRFTTLHGLLLQKHKDDPETLDAYLGSVIDAKKEWQHRGELIGRVLVSGNIRRDIKSATEIEPMATQCLVDAGIPESVAELCSYGWPEVNKLLALTTHEISSQSIGASIERYKGQIIDRVAWNLQSRHLPEEVRSKLHEDLMAITEQQEMLRRLLASH